jgi:hypothetical protein
MKRIDKLEILEAQKNLADRIVRIGKAFLRKEDYHELAKKMIDDLYGYNEGPVLFKPTKAAQKQFRLTRAGAVSYFAGMNEEFPEDHGFALKPWQNVRFENSGFIFYEDHALVMGNYYFMDLDGNETKVEYTLGYIRTETGALKINIHHSSLPYRH